MEENKKEKKLPKTERRTMTECLLRETAKADKRSVELAFSSEEPVVRPWGIEILSHEPSAVRTTRSTDGLPLLFDHDRKQQVGRVYNIRLCSDKDKDKKKARGEARFGRSQFALEKWGDVEDGLLRDVSVGYAVHFAQEVSTKELNGDLMELAAREKLPVYRITDWEPYECSLVTVPADPTVGVGRTADPEGERSEEKDKPAAIQGATLTTENARPLISQEERKMAEDTPKQLDLLQYEEDLKKERTKAAGDARDKERLRVQGINDLWRQFKNAVPDFIRKKAVDEGTSLEDFQAMVLNRIGDGTPIDTPVTEIGLSPKEARRYSITRAILSQLPGNKVDASFEMACHAEVQKRMDSPAKGILVPYEVMQQEVPARRDLSLGSGAVGAYLKGTDHLGSEFIDLLRNRMLIRQLGARVLSGLRGNIAIPTRTAGASSYWVAEGVAPTEGTTTFGQVTLSPRNVAAHLNYTRNLLLQSNPSIDALVNDDLAKSLATAIDLAAFHGTGTDQPQGIVGASGVGSVTATSVDYGKMLDFQVDLAAANALAPNCAYVTTPTVAAILASEPKHATSGNSGWLWEGGILESNNVCGFRGFATNQITAGYMIFGDFSQLLLGEWGVLELTVDPYYLATTGVIRVVAFQSVDVALRYGAAFTLSTSVTAP